MATDHSRAARAGDFWSRYRTGVEIAVAGTSSDELLGVRDGFVRYLRDGLLSEVPVVVVPHAPQSPERELGGLLVSDEATLGAARRKARALEERLAADYDFFVASEGGLHSASLGDDECVFVRCWTVVRGPLGEAFGGSGSQQIPQRVWAGSSFPGGSMPGTRRSGGMLSGLTARLENRRSAVALATFHALATLFYETLGSPPPARGSSAGR